MGAWCFFQRSLFGVWCFAQACETEQTIGASIKVAAATAELWYALLWLQLIQEWCQQSFRMIGKWRGKCHIIAVWFYSSPSEGQQFPDRAINAIFSFPLELFNQVRFLMEIMWPIILFMGLVWLRRVNPLYRQHECKLIFLVFICRGFALQRHALCSVPTL